MYQDLITKSGLSKDQAAVYSTLLEGGNMTARKIALKTGLKRGLAYKVIDQLIDIGLAEKNDKIGKITMFFPAHPTKIKEVLKKRQEEIMSAEAALSGVMSQMVSSFNLISGKPNVQFFEGEEGIKEVLNDSLQSSEEILTYLDIEALMTTLPKENEWYVSQRAKLGIKKRGLVLDSPFNRKFLRDYHKEITDTRFLSCSGVPFNTIMQIYDNKVSYITISNTIRIGVIIEDPNIYTMHKFLFNCLWEKSQKINE